MINRLDRYCSLWGLSINLDKSKIIVFRKGGGVLANNEQWKYRGQRVEVVKEYNYLGFKIVANMNINKHIDAKINEAKAAMAVTWDKCMNNANVTPEAKFKLFQSTAMSTALYAAPCFGYMQFNAIEGLQRLFIKRTYKLPNSTPNYVISLETKLPDLFLTTLKLHFEFVIKLLTSKYNKISKDVAKYIINRKILWFKEWFELAEKVNFNLTLTIDEPETWQPELSNLLSIIYNNNLMMYERKARESTARCMYPLLTYSLGENSYFNSKYRPEVIATILKARSEMLNLNYMPNRRDRSGICSICNVGEIETVVHFIGICPTLALIRCKYFNKDLLNNNEIIDILNGMMWLNLYNYCKDALRKRNSIINNITHNLNN